MDNPETSTTVYTRDTGIPKRKYDSCNKNNPKCLCHVSTQLPQSCRQRKDARHAMYKLENEKLANNEEDRFKPTFKQLKHVYF
jgi:hypothetical protein